MFHDTRDQDICSVAYCIDLNLFSLKVFIYKDWVILCDSVNDSDEFINIIVVDCNLHSLSTKNVGRTNQYRISKSVCNFFRFLCCEYCSTCRTRDLTLFKNLIKELTVFGFVYILCRCTKDRYSHLHKCFCQLDCCLSTKLYNCSVRFLNINDTLYIFRRQRLEVQLISNVKVSTYCLRVIIYNDCLISVFCKCPCTMYRTEVELDTLTDTDRTGSKNKYFLLIFCLFNFILASIYRVVIWCLCGELCCTSIYDLICCNDSVCMTHIVNFLLCLTCQLCNYIIRELDTFCFCKKLRCKFLCLQSCLHLCDDRKFIDKPLINFCNLVDQIVRDSSSACFCDSPHTHVIYFLQLIDQFIICQICEVIRHQTVYMLLQRTDCFHKSSLEVITDAHNFSGCFHLCCQCSLRTDKFIKWKSRDLNYYIVKHWLKTCIGLLCDCILDLIQIVSKCDLRCNLRDRVSCCFGSKCRRTAYTRVYLDYTILECLRV